MADFLTTCSADQIRMAPEKCMSPWVVKSNLASPLTSCSAMVCNFAIFLTSLYVCSPECVQSAQGPGHAAQHADQRDCPTPGSGT
jgi:hypothetical protein